MSAFDIAGAVVWTPLAVALIGLSIADRLTGWMDNKELAFMALVAAAPLGLSAFCIARLFGASL
jgi:hypothetical protein